MYEIFSREVLMAAYIGTGKGNAIGVFSSEDWARKVGVSLVQGSLLAHLAAHPFDTVMTRSRHVLCMSLPWLRSASALWACSVGHLHSS